VTILLATATNSTSTINDVEPGLLGFLVVAAMGIALVFLLRSMNKQFRKIGPKPEEELPLEDFELGEDVPAGAVAGEVLSREDAGPDSPR
jgi:hypothetical protein